MGIWSRLKSIIAGGRTGGYAKLSRSRRVPKRGHANDIIECCIAGYTVRLSPADGFPQILGETTSNHAGGGVNSDEVCRFLKFYVNTPVGPAMLRKKRTIEVEHSMAQWQLMNGPKAQDGKLKQAIPCGGFTLDGRGCTKYTKHPSGLCPNHRKPGALTMWNHEWVSGETQRAQAERERESRQAQIDGDRRRREAKWKSVAGKITYSATDRQIYLLLDLGVPPRELQGIDKQGASRLIDDLLKKRWQ